jgi:predicted RNase H-like HicB family nuclease
VFLSCLLHIAKGNGIGPINNAITAIYKDVPLLQLRWMPHMTLTAVYMKVPEGFVAFVEELPGANTQGETLDEARANLHEAVAMVLDANRELLEQSLQGADVIRETLTLPAA